MGRSESVAGEIARLRAQIAEAGGRIQQALAVARGALDAIEASDAEARQPLTEAAAHLRAEHPYRFAEWDSEIWARWAPQPGIPPEIRVGSFPSLDDLPATVPVFDEHPIVVATESAGAATAARELLRALAVRAAVELGDRVVLHLLDPGQGGFGFPERAVLSQDAAASGDPARDLERVVEAGREFTRRHEGVRSRDLSDTVRLSTPVHVVIALDFPHGYGYVAVERLNEVARLGPAGIQLIVHHDVKAPDSGGDLALTGAHVIEVDDRGTATGPWGSLVARADPAAPPQLVAQIAAGTPLRDDSSKSDGTPQHASLSEIVGPEKDWWRESARVIARARIGTLDDGTPLELKFGNDESSNSWYGQAAVAGTTGTGKSFLVHAALLSLATRYPPDELRFFIFDGQDGVTSQSYVDLPHADVVSMHTPIDLLRTVIADVRAELTRRNVLATTAGVDTIARYWDVTGGVSGMPRLVVVIEEYQALLADDTDGVVEATLKEITSTGRKAGVHLLLISQRFSATGLLGMQGLFANIDTRVSMRLDQREVDTAPFGKEGRALIGQLAGPQSSQGRVVVNDVLGADPASLTGTVASFGNADDALKTVTATVDAIAAHSRHLGVGDRPIVLDGAKSPSPDSSRQFDALANLAAGADDGTWAAAVERWAGASARDGGLDQSDWRAYQHPVPLIVGRSFDVFGAAAIRLDREPHQNVLMISSAPELLAGATVSALVSAALASRRGTLDVTVLAETPHGGSWDGMLSDHARGLLGGRGHQLHVATDPSQATTLLDRAEAELSRRVELDAAAQAGLGPFLVVGIDADRLAVLRAPDTDQYDAQPEARLGRLLRDGPDVGIHVVLGFSGVNALRRVIPNVRNQRRWFAHKLVGQMSVTDSREVLDDDFGSKVAGAGPHGPRRFGYHNDVNGAGKRLLLPYTTDGDIIATLSPFIDAGT